MHAAAPRVGQVDPQVRPVLPTDAAALLALYAEMSRESPTVAARTASFVERFAQYHVVAELDGVVVARAALVRTPGMPADTIAAGIGVTASARRRGVGTALWDALAGRVQDGTRWVLAFSDDRDDLEVLPFTRRHHLVPFQHSIASELNLGTAAAGPPPIGVSVEVLDPWATAEDADVAALYADSDTSPDSAEIGARSWAEELTGAREMGDRGLLVLLRRDGRPVAMSMAVEQDAGDWHVLYTGVRPDARGQGLAAVAKQHLHHAAAELGGRRAETDNEAGNAGIRRVNAALGYRELKGTRRFRRDLHAQPLP